MTTESHAGRNLNHGLWAATAAPPQSYPSLTGEHRTGVVVIGAGFTGLSAAVHLAEAGARVAVLDTHFPGYGASGRNGGSVIPGFKLFPSELRAAYGEQRGQAMADFGGSIVDFTFDLIKRLGIPADGRRNGWIYAAHSPVALPMLRQRFDDWARLGAPVEWIDRDQMSAKLGTRSYFGGYIDRRGGSLQPLSYSRGLAAAAARLGAEIFSNSPARSLTREGGAFRVTTPQGVIVADNVIVATNGYTDNLVPGLKGCIVPFQSAQVATEPLPADLRASVMSSECAVSDSRRSLLYFRRSPDGRFVMGGRGGVLGATDESHWGYLRNASEKLFPQMKGIRWEFAWSGIVAITPDYMPRIYEPDPRMHIGLGYNGRGVAMATAFGKLLADRVLGQRNAEMPVPVTDIAPMPFAPFRRLGAAAVSKWYRMKDERELREAERL